MKNIFFVLVLLFSMVQTNFAQVTFSHAFGAGYGVTADIETAASPLLHYAPRLNFLSFNNDEASLAVGSNIGLGGFINGNSQTGGSAAFGLDLPITVSANFGHCVTPDSDAGFGGFVGAGFGYSFLTSGEPNSAFGPVIEAGMRAVILDRSYGVRASYMLNLKSENVDVITVSLLYNINAI